MPAASSVQARINKLCDSANIEVGKDAFGNAKKFYTEALSLGEESMPRQMRIGVRQDLAECCVRLKNFKEAADCNRALLRLLEEEWSDEYGAEHTLTIGTRGELARNLSELSDQADAPPGSLKEAVELQTKNVDILKSQKQFEALAEAQHRLAYDITKRARSIAAGPRAEKLFRKAASLYEKVLKAWQRPSEPASSHRLINARHNYAVVLYHLEDYEEAKRVFLENQAVLDSLSETSKKGLKVLERNADRYLASCIEKTNDLSLGISRRPTNPLDDVKPTDGTRQASTPSLRVDSPGKPSKSPDRAREPKQQQKDVTSMPGSFPDEKSDVGDANTDTSASSSDNKKRKGSETDQATLESSTKENPDARLQPDGERQSRSKQKASESMESAKAQAVNGSSGPHLTPTDDGIPKRSRSDPNKKPLLEPETTRKSRSHSAAGLETAVDGTPGKAANDSPTTDGQLFGIPASANDADRWMIRIRQHAHTLLAYNTPLTNRRRVRVAILDSGVQLGKDRKSSRSDIWRRRARFIDYKDFTGENTHWSDSSKKFHGSDCASLLLQVAPETDVYIANVWHPETEGIEPSHVAEALKWAISEKKVDIISMSLGWDNWKHKVAEQINFARQKHILVFAAASNDGRLENDYGVYPAWEPTVFCINASSGSGVKWERNPLYSEDKVNLMFLGQDIAILGSNNKPEFPGDRLTGTSFATPIAAATAALVLDLVRLKGSIYPKVERCLKTYEGMSAVFQAMSGKPTEDGYYHVMPWRLLGEKKPPFAPEGENETNQWYSLTGVAECLRRFGNVHEQLD
jgi:tetratricopeptide (TPR) repeat protein